MAVENTPTPRELGEKLEELFFSTEEAMEYYIGIFKHAKSIAKSYEDVAKDAKAKISEVIEETAQMNWETESGKCYVTKPSVSIRYDPGALDALMDSDDSLKRVLEPHRKESQRAGSLTIR